MARLVGDRAFALSIAGALAATTAAAAIPPISLADVAAGDGGFVINTPASNFYIWVADGAGDVNGDGLNDVIAGRWGAVVVFGKADGAPVDAGDIIDGVGDGFYIEQQPYSTLGFSVSRARDVNGDGFDDLTVGEPEICYSTINCYYGGTVHVVFGKDDTAPIDLSDSDAGAFRVFGDDSMGRASSDAADVNGDGLPDVVLGAPYVCDYTYYNGKCGFANAHGDGRTYVVFGKEDDQPVTDNDLLAGNGGFVIHPVDPDTYTGSSVSGGADVNGDSLGDVIVGAPEDDPGGVTDAGAAYVVFGKADGPPVELSQIGGASAGFAIHGCFAGRAAGQVVSVAGDANGDDLDDVVVTDQLGAYVVFGKADMDPVSLCDVGNGIGGFAIDVDATVSDAAVLGDVNDDGLADIAVSDDFGSGTVYIVYGKSDGAPVNGMDVLDGVGGFAILGTSNEQAGRTVSGARDVNGDGRNDLVIAAPGTDPQGAAYVVFNPLVLGDIDGDGAVGTIDLLSLLASWGPCPTPCVPYCPGDLDRDCTVGTSDLLILLAGWG